MSAPTHLKHKPIVSTVQYENNDGKHAGNTDAKALSIGEAQYESGEISAKIWRNTGTKWSRQSEEMPLHRALDLSILIIASLKRKDSEKKTSLNEIYLDSQSKITDYYMQNKQWLDPRIDELEKLIEEFRRKP